VTTPITSLDARFAVWLDDAMHFGVGADERDRPDQHPDRPTNKRPHRAEEDM
jgi:hypothetical protein